MQQITPLQLKAWLEDSTRKTPKLLDVREPAELEICGLPQAQHIPMNDVPARLPEIDKDAELVVMCHHGGRSMQVAAFLERNGFAHIHNLSGGIDAWAREVDPSMRTY